jgi:hypothetical protein
MIVYIAGPMTGLPDFNRAEFNIAAKRIKDARHVVLNPAILPDGLTHQQYLKICISLLECANAIYMLRGWKFLLALKRSTN